MLISLLLPIGHFSFVLSHFPRPSVSPFLFGVGSLPPSVKLFQFVVFSLSSSVKLFPVRVG